MLWETVDAQRDGSLYVVLEAEGDGLRLTVSDADQWEEPVRITRAEAVRLRDALTRHLEA